MQPQTSNLTSPSPSFPSYKMGMTLGLCENSRRLCKVEWPAQRTCSLHGRSYSKNRGFIEAPGNTCSFSGPLKGPNQFPPAGFPLVSETREPVFLSLDPQVPALDPQIDTQLRAPASKPADCHVAPVTLAALCHLPRLAWPALNSWWHPAWGWQS